MDNFRKISILGLILSLGLMGCGDDDGNPDTGRDTGMDTGGDDGGDPDTGFDAGPLPDGGPDAFAFMAGDGMQIDRMGMPAVSTAFLADMKEDYNRATPADDVMPNETLDTFPMFAPTIAISLGTLLSGEGLAGDGLTAGLAGAGLTSCEDTTAEIPLNAVQCAFQPVAPDLPVINLVVPDTLTLDTTMPAGFPNGRQLADRAMDITLAVVLLDLTVEGQGPTTFFDLDPEMAGDQSLNPAANDVAFNDAFPYLADAQ